MFQFFLKWRSKTMTSDMMTMTSDMMTITSDGGHDDDDGDHVNKWFF